MISIVFVIVLFTLCTFAVVLNGLALFLIARKPPSRNGKVLNAILISLSACCGLSGAFTAAELVMELKHIHDFRRLVLSVRHMLIITTIFHVGLLTLDRMFAVTCPIRHNRLLSRKRICIVLAILILSSFVLTLKIGELRVHLIIICGVIFFVSAFIAIAYVKIFRVISASRKRRKRLSVNSASTDRRNTRLVKMCTVICVAFYCCNLPAAVILVYSYSTLKDQIRMFHGEGYVHMFGFVGLVCSYVANPIVYILCDHKLVRRTKKRRSTTV